jgi:hypothetical protein
MSFANPLGISFGHQTRFRPDLPHKALSPPLPTSSRPKSYHPSHLSLIGPVPSALTYTHILTLTHIHSRTHTCVHAHVPMPMLNHVYTHPLAHAPARSPVSP